MNKLLLFSFSMMLFLTGCKPFQATTGKKNNTPKVAEYEEDLSNVRPRYDVSAVNMEPKYETSPTPVEATKVVKTSQAPITMHVNDQVAAVLDSMAARNKSIKYTDGFKIQLYVGNVRADVDAAKIYAYQLYPELSPYMTFSQPTYKLKVGDFMSRSDADRYLANFRQQYAGATIVSDKIEIRKSLMVK